MYRTNTCGELRIENAGQTVTLAGWVQGVHNLGALTFVDLRDRYGITQLAFNEDSPEELRAMAGRLGREFVIQATGQVAERYSKNGKLATGDIEILVTEMKIISESQTPPFTIEDNTDGGDELRMKYRYLDLRRSCVRKNLEASPPYDDTHTQLPRLPSVHRGGDADTHRLHTGRRPRLRCALTHESRAVLCAAAKPPDTETTAHGLRL